MTPADVLSLLKEKEAKFVDLRFTDTRGKEQHVTVPAHTIDEGFFEDGKMFDGSSIAGWKGINESDMILMPDAATAVVDVFTEDATVAAANGADEPQQTEMVLSMKFIAPRVIVALFRRSNKIQDVMETMLTGTLLGFRDVVLEEDVLCDTI